jgi:hypothetical protein
MNQLLTEVMARAGSAGFTADDVRQALLLLSPEPPKS